MNITSDKPYLSILHFFMKHPNTTFNSIWQEDIIYSLQTVGLRIWEITVPTRDPQIQTCQALLVD